jgi:hypothetical protein
MAANETPAAVRDALSTVMGGAVADLVAEARAVYAPCDHISYKACTDCQYRRLDAVVDRLADAVETADRLLGESDEELRSLREWQRNHVAPSCTNPTCECVEARLHRAEERLDAVRALSEAWRDHSHCVIPDCLQCVRQERCADDLTAALGDAP